MLRRTAAVTLLVIAPALAQTTLPHLHAVPFPRVRIDDPFFAPRRATNRTVTLEHALAQLESSGTLQNFDRAARGEHQGFEGYVFQDSDAYKALEAIAYALAEERDPALEAKTDAVIARIASAQQQDGYLDTCYAVKHPGERFVNLRDDHELYCAGHLFEAAAAHFVATGKKNLLDIATRYADLLVKTFGPGGRDGYCGHPEVELALVELADATGKREYLELAKTFVDRRGSHFFATEHHTDPARYDGTYWLDHVPVRDLPAIAGHAVRAAYLMSGAVDIAAAFDDRDLLRMSKRVWHNTFDKNVFITGGIGPSASNEGFTTDYDLPTQSAYQESCASIAVAMWAHRMNLLTGDGRYCDAMETALYNAIPAGVQLDGTKFFYVNPLSSRGNHHRRGWFGCACCPPNLARTFARLGTYVAATGDGALYVNLYLRGELRATLGQDEFAFTVASEYPWDGKVELSCTKAPARDLTLRLRIPGWCDGAHVACNGDDVTAKAGREHGYATLRRTFAAGDRISLSFPMPVRALQADPRAEALSGRVAFQRGPIVYCVEQCDQQAPVEELVAPPGTTLVPEHRKDLLGGVTVLTGDLVVAKAPQWDGGELYRALPPTRTVRATLVPYAVWDNRAAGPMAVFLPQAPPMPRVGGPELAATIELSFTSGNCDPEGLRDGQEPKRSGDTPPRNAHFWPHKGGTEWAQYTWQEPRALAGCRIFWFDDTGHGECKLPQAARLLWKDGDQWRPVAVTGEPLPIAVDRWCEVKFAPVTTTALRLEVDQQDRWASGVLEWQVVPAAPTDGDR
jgi:DUF1680 family protein